MMNFFFKRGETPPASQKSPSSAAKANELGSEAPAQTEESAAQERQPGDAAHISKEDVAPVAASSHVREEIQGVGFEGRRQVVASVEHPPPHKAEQRERSESETEIEGAQRPTTRAMVQESLGTHTEDTTERMSEDGHPRRQGLQQGCPNEAPMEGPHQLMISSQRRRPFYERSVRELFASGHQSVQLSALGNAVPVATDVALILESKAAGIIRKIETGRLSVPQGSPSKRTAHPPLINIVIERHPDFKGTRIAPGRILFLSSAGLSCDALAYPKDPEYEYGCVNAAPSTQIFLSTPFANSLRDALTEAGHDVTGFDELHKHLYSEAQKINENVASWDGIRFVGELAAVKTRAPSLKSAFVRVAPPVGPTSTDMTGTVFIHVFETTNRPHQHVKNVAYIHIVSPDGSHFEAKEAFLAAVQSTATNLMASLCDYNEYVRRADGSLGLSRLGLVRVGMFSASFEDGHSQCSPEEVADAILAGLDQGFLFGTAPRLEFCSPDGTLEQAWKKLVPLEAAEAITPPTSQVV